MQTLTRIHLRDEVDETLHALVDKAAHPYDAFHSKAQEQSLEATLKDRWQAGVTRALQMLRGQVALTASNVDYILAANLSGTAITRHLAPAIAPELWTAFNNGRAASSALYARQTGKEPVKKSDWQNFTFGPMEGTGTAAFGAIFGLTEDHALQAMLDQITIAAGGFWDNQLSDSIKAELEGYFAGTETREQLIAKIENMVNTRLAINGQSSLPTSYFDNLATHQIVRARNVGSYYRAKSLGAVRYTIMNPHDRRTCAVCNSVSHGEVYQMSDAEAVIAGILTANSTADLKAVAPFYKPGDTVTTPVPPLHWAKCRCWMNFEF